MKEKISIKTKLILLTGVILWASAFAGIRAGLEGYTPGALALLRFLIASVCMLIMHSFISKKIPITWRDRGILLLIGLLGLGVYNIALNHGELEVSSGIASFIVSLSPLVSLIFALIFLHESITPGMVVGMLISVLGVGLIMLGKTNHFSLQSGFFDVVIAMIVGGFFSVMQKPFLRKYHAIEVTAYIIWGATIFLAVYTPQLLNNIHTASLHATAAVVYLGIFPAAAGYIAWSYALKEMPVAQAVNYLYFLPIIATIIGWLWLGEIPPWISLLGGLVALLGVWIVGRSK
ncbi:MAG TPA: DMT family transporter [Gammaproteobacteria bacterium]|nr:DMT family transporter [Gammaproteobacteria bacterium]